MRKKFLILLSFLLIFSLISVGIFFAKNSKLKKEVMYLESTIDDLEDKVKKQKSEIETLEDEKGEMEDKLSSVKHFDRSSYSSGLGSGISYTGSAIETKIDGDFEGWDGETIFKMMDGTIWQQVSYDYTYHYAYMPDVLIYTKGGSFYMKVEGVDDEIRVTRIK